MKENIFIPDSSDNYLERTTHLSIGAHQDDIEIMSADGICKCIDSDTLWFGAIVCTDGSGAPKTSEYSHYSVDEMRNIRVTEQIEASRFGKYSFVTQLGFTSVQAKSQDKNLVDAIKQYLLACKPSVIYTHNPFDKHPTHVAIFKATLAALKEIKNIYWPEMFLGCEVWRNLDWISDDKKVVLNLTGNDNFLMQLLSIFKSQIAGGKRYDLATLGRMRANATFFESHSCDQAELISFALDLKPLIEDEGLETFLNEYIDSLVKTVRQNLLS